MMRLVLQCEVSRTVQSGGSSYKGNILGYIQVEELYMLEKLGDNL